MHHDVTIQIYSILYHKIGYYGKKYPYQKKFKNLSYNNKETKDLSVKVTLNDGQKQNNRKTVQS